MGEVVVVVVLDYKLHFHINLLTLFVPKESLLLCMSDVKKITAHYSEFLQFPESTKVTEQRNKHVTEN